MAVITAPAPRTGTIAPAVTLNARAFATATHLRDQLALAVAIGWQTGVRDLAAEAHMLELDAQIATLRIG